MTGGLIGGIDQPAAKAGQFRTLFHSGASNYRSYYVALSNHRKVGKKPPYIAP